MSATMESATTGVRRLVTLAYPADAAAALDRISVLEPLGMALLGARVGQVLDVPGPRGRAQMRIEALLHQPERSLREDLILCASRHPGDAQ